MSANSIDLFGYNTTETSISQQSIHDRKNECLQILNRWKNSAKIKNNKIAYAECEKILAFIAQLT